MSRKLTAARWLEISLVVALALTGCGDPENPAGNGSAGPDQNTTTQDNSQGAARDAVANFVNDFSTNLASHLRAHSGSAGRMEAIKAALEATPSKKDDPLSRRALVKSLYTSPNGDVTPLNLVAAGEMTKGGSAIFEALGKASDHGLDTSRYHLEDIETILPTLAEKRQALADVDIAPLSAEEKKKVVAAIRTAGYETSDAKAVEKTVALLSASSSPVTRLAKAASSLESASEKLNKSEALLELTLAQGLLIYGWDMRFANHHWFRDVELPDPTKEKAALKTKLEELLVDAILQASEGGLENFIQNLPPQFDQYQKLIDALATYRAFAENGGWEPVKKIAVRRGGKNERIKALKQRLATEGYYDPPEDQKEELSTKWDKNLRAGIKRYQTTHQLRVTGESSKPFWKSVNISAEDRAKQIALTLQRWRESRIGHEERYIFVNISDFHAEGWVEGERKTRFKVVTGNTQEGCDRRRKVITYVNATPMMSNKIQAVILNPFWNIPERILKEEILPEYKENPEYLTENGYECVKERDGACIRMRQQGGENNALG
jgi:murein L,D-transpeptidase YcbB/YkuD